MCGSVSYARTSSTIIINDNSSNSNSSDNYMRQSILVHNNNDLFGVNKSNWRKKLATPNYQNRINKNQVSLKASFRQRQRHRHHTLHGHFIPVNWINIRRVSAVKAKRANRHTLPILTTTHLDSEHTPTNLNVHFEWNSRYFFSISPEIYSR